MKRIEWVAEVNMNGGQVIGMSEGRMTVDELDVLIDKGIIFPMNYEAGRVFINPKHIASYRTTYAELVGFDD